MVCGMFVWCSLCVSVCMLTVSNALLMSSPNVIVRSCGLFWLKPVATVLFRFQRSWPTSGGTVRRYTITCKSRSPTILVPTTPACTRWNCPEEDFVYISIFSASTLCMCVMYLTSFDGLF